MPRRKTKTDLPFWWRKQTRCYYVQKDGKQVRLSPDLDEAWRLYHELMAEGPKASDPPPAVVSCEPLVAEICDQFLVWVEGHKAPLTFTAYRQRLQHFLDSLKRHGEQYLIVSELRPYHVTRVLIERGAGWSNTSKNDIVSACQRAFNWAARQGLVRHNPLAGMEKPGREDRELAITPAEFEEILASVKEPNFRDLLRFTWESGVRPQEIVRIEARFVQLELHRIVFPVKESKGKKARRVIYLTEGGEAILRPLIEKHPTGSVFRNSEGRGWNKNSINCAFCRLEKKLGRKIHLGAFRKGFATEALKNGVDTITLANLMGHANSVMVSKVYAKVQQDPAFMARAAKRARGEGA
jgi:site-specific recombinase XerD